MKTSRNLFAFLLLLSSSFLFSCSHAKQETEDRRGVSEQMPPSAMPSSSEKSKSINEESGAASLSKETNTKSLDKPKDQTTQVVEKVAEKIIKNAEISFEVKDFSKATTAIKDIVKSHSAYISNENQTNNQHSLTNILIIRVKSENFEKLLDALKKESIHLDYNNMTAQDVTAEFVDVQAHLKAKKEVEVQYYEVLKKARTVSEIMDVQNSIGQIRAEIDSYEGQLKLMQDQVTYSTIRLTYYEKLEYMPATDNGFLYRVGKAFVTGWNMIVSLFVGLIYVWPFLLIIGVILFIVLRIIAKEKKRKA